MNKVFLAIIFAMALLVLPIGIQYTIGQNNSGTIPKHFLVQKVVYAFDVGGPLCSFNATSGSMVNISLSTTGDDSYQTIFRVIRNNHGIVFSSSIGGNREVTNFNQTVTLDYDDSYNISVAKHPFYTTVKINGVVDLYLKEETNATNVPTYSPSPTIPEYPALIITSFFLIITSLWILIVTKKKEKKKEVEYEQFGENAYHIQADIEG